MPNSVADTGLAIVACGGTIQNTASGRIGVDDVLGNLPAAARAGIPKIEVHDLFRVGSEDLEPLDWLVIARSISRIAERADIGGIVVTHGTYTVEETSYFVHLCVKTTKPVVFTCSQRKHGALGNDGDRNLVDAIRVASAPEAAGSGALLVMGEEIHGARDVRKTNQRPGGFSSGSLGALGSVEQDQVTLYRKPTRRHTSESEFCELRAETLPRVDIVVAYPGADDALVRAAVEAGAQGIVVHGYAPQGKPHRHQRRALMEAAAQNITVVLTSRGGEGRVAYDESIPLTGRCIGGDNLSPQKARVLLMLALAAPRSAADLHRIFRQY
ncbi:MAG TPA: asparaginase [Casimicrobiaceae bacterium]|nr:asparaginase [Casimicrobiaceae bacterium]